MNDTFHAKSVVFEHPEQECSIVGFADEQYNTKQYLLLQCAFEHNEQDMQFGQNIYHVEWCGQENSGYSCIREFLVYRDHVKFTLTPDVVETFGGLAGANITFNIDDTTFNFLRQRLGDIFRDSDCVLVFKT